MKFTVITIVSLLFVVSCKEAPKKEQKSAVEQSVEHVKTVEVALDTVAMVYFEGGKISIGSSTRLANEQPVFEKEVTPFYLDKNLVSVADFRNFIQATGYKTEADKFGDSGVFSFEKGDWSLLKGANWEFPLGPNEPKALDNHPVTHVSWNDANAYAQWCGKRLPTEFEWEFAAKNGKNSNDIYAWGNDLIVDGKYKANVWQGSSARDLVVSDGYLLTSPVGVFGENASGLTDMGGNVWQWCDSYYKVYPINETSAPQSPNVRVTRGGSFMYDQALENSYTTTFRGQNSVDTSLFNMGFRCAK